MSDRQPRLHQQLLQDLAELRLTQIAATYQEILDEASRKNTSTLEVLASLVASEVTQRRQQALERRIQRAKLPPRKTLEDYNFDYPKRIPKQKVLRLFDCEFVSQHHSAILIGRTGTGKTHLLNALAYTACDKGISVRWTRAIDMINVLTTAQMNGTLEKKLREYTRPELLLLDELGYLPIDKRGADLMFQVVAARYAYGTVWYLVSREKGNATEEILPGTVITAFFDGLHTVSGTSGCNEYTASYASSQTSMVIGQPGATKKACENPPGVMEQENLYLVTLQKGAAYSVANKSMPITDSQGKTILTYTSSPRGTPVIRRCWGRAGILNRMLMARASPGPRGDSPSSAWSLPMMERPTETQGATILSVNTR